ncbi:MAG TPA: transposase [Elusimicrobiota bacterium]|nr:transposase [Elusimicrobiota bacterium]
MPRPPRIHYPGAVYHVMARGVDGREIFADDSDRQAFLAAAHGLSEDTSCTILAYCLMGNHFHLALRVGKIPLSRIMHRLLSRYAMAFNFRHDRQGHLFLARYKSILCLDDAYLIGLVRYIHMNPVRAGFVSAPEGWPWSSHLVYAGKDGGGFVDKRVFFDALGGQGYEQWMSGGDAKFSPWPEPLPSSPLLREEAFDDEVDNEPVDKIASDLFPEDLIEIRSESRRRDLSLKRKRLAKAALQRGHTLASIAEWLGRTPSALHQLLNN